MVTAWCLSWRASWQVWRLEIISCQRRGSKQLLPGMDKTERGAGCTLNPKSSNWRGRKGGVVFCSRFLHKAQIQHKHMPTTSGALKRAVRGSWFPGLFACSVLGRPVSPMFPESRQVFVSRSLTVLYPSVLHGRSAFHSNKLIFNLIFSFY